MALLGYPVYFTVLIGVWKVLGTIALLVPGFPRLKEWAYAGIFFNMTGAFVSHPARGDYGAGAFHLIVTLALVALTVASWALRPQSRILRGPLPSPVARGRPSTHAQRSRDRARNGGVRPALRQAVSSAVDQSR